MAIIDSLLVFSDKQAVSGSGNSKVLEVGSKGLGATAQRISLRVFFHKAPTGSTFKVALNDGATNATANEIATFTIASKGIKDGDIVELGFPYKHDKFLKAVYTGTATVTTYIG